MSAEIVALLILLGGAVAAVVFTLVVVVVVDRSVAATPEGSEREQSENERRDPGSQ